MSKLCLAALQILAKSAGPYARSPGTMIKGGGVRLNNVKVDEELQTVTESDLIDGKMFLIAAGKKNKMVVRVE
eukprot:365600-Chlamydomonas_euryale.AAC.4